MLIGRDIRLDNALEAMIEQYVHEIGEETAMECPIIQGMTESLGMIKASNNAEVRLELGIVGEKGSCLALGCLANLLDACGGTESYSSQTSSRFPNPVPEIRLLDINLIYRLGSVIDIPNLFPEEYIN
jgi:hypothetical protein